MIQENKFRGTNERGGGILQRGAHRKHTYAKEYLRPGPTEPIRSHDTKICCWIWSKKDLAVVFNFVARFGSRPPPTVSPPPSSTAPAPAAAGNRDPPHQRASASSTPQSPPQLLPAPTNPPNSRAPPGHFRRKFVPKLRFFFFFALLLSLPRPPPPFSFLTPPRSAPLLLLRLIVFSRRKARVFDGGDRGFASGGVDLVPRWRRDYGFGEISLARF